MGTELEAHWMSSKKFGWEREYTSIAAHVVQMREHLQEMSHIATANLAKAKRKQYYDKKARPQTLEVGDKVLVMVPIKCSKLQLEWVGPYNITKQVTPANYEVTTPGRHKTRRIYFVDLLRYDTPLLIQPHC